LIILENVFPITILDAVKNCQEVVRIFCATGNPTHAIVARHEQGGGVLGIIDGHSPLGIETDDDIADRKSFLRNVVGYKF
jgi:adenosine/AMP kinase